VKACPQHAIDVRGYADFAPLGHSVRVLREEEKGTISWKIKYRDGRERISRSRSGPRPGARSRRRPSTTRPTQADSAPRNSRTSRRRSRSGCAAGSPRLPDRTQAGSGLWPLFIAENGVVDADILVIGGGIGGCGATYESRYWGRDLKVVCVEKANIERSGAVAHGLYAINCYMGMQWNENQPEDHVRYARNDLMGLVREDLGYDIARHVDSTVHKFEEWGLPIMKDPETGRYLREGKWQIMIHGESYKPIVAEAASKSATEVYNRIMVTHLLMDRSKPNRVAGAVGFNVRDGNFYVFRAKAVIVAAGGASHIFKPRAVGEGMGRTWYAPWSSASAYACRSAGRQDDQMENRIVLTLQGRLRPGGRLLPACSRPTPTPTARSTRPRPGTRSRQWSASMRTGTRCRPACATTPCWRRSRPAGAHPHGDQGGLRYPQGGPSAGRTFSA
jgi:hypothetical protein